MSKKDFDFGYELWDAERDWLAYEAREKRSRNKKVSFNCRIEKSLFLAINHIANFYNQKLNRVLEQAFIYKDLQEKEKENVLLKSRKKYKKNCLARKKTQRKKTHKISKAARIKQSRLINL